MMLTGRNVRAGRAKSLGLVDAVVPERHVKAAAQAAVSGKLKTRRGGMLIAAHQHHARAQACSPSACAREAAKKSAARALSGALRADRSVGDPRRRRRGHAEGRDRIVRAALVTDTSRNLVRVFFLREKLKGLADGEWAGQRVHVIGAGAMGGDIAAWCAWHGFTVSLADMKPEPLAKAIERAADLYGKIGHKRIDIRDALDRLIPDLTGEGVRTADLVIEAVPETLELKRKVYAAIEPKMRPDAILATNTSSIPLEQLRTGLQRPRATGRRAFLQSGVAHAAGRGGEPRPGGGRCARQGARVPRPHRPAAGAGEERAGLPGQPRAHALHARSHGDADRGQEARDHRRGGGKTSACRWGRSSSPIRSASTSACTLPRCSKPASTGRCPTSRNGSGRRSTSGELGRKTGKGFYDWKDGKAVKDRDAPAPHRRDDRPPHSADARRLRRLPARGRGGGRGDGRRRHDLRDRLCAVPRRPDALCQRRAASPRSRQTLWQFSERYGERFRPDPGWDRLT